MNRSPLYKPHSLYFGMLVIIPNNEMTIVTKILLKNKNTIMCGRNPLLCSKCRVLF